MMSAPDIFYVMPGDVFPDRVILRTSEHHHLKNVHHKRVGDSILAINGQGTAWLAEISIISDDSTTAVIRDTHECYGEPEIDLTLAVGIPKKDKFEWILEKGTELGVNHFVPLLTQRTLVKPGHKKMDRWQRIVISAIKQCRRSRIPSISDPVSFEFYINTHPATSVGFIAHEAYTPQYQLCQQSANTAKSLSICIGPEGGFTEKETELARENDFKLISLGPRRLRTETAALAAATVFLTLSRS